MAQTFVKKFFPHFGNRNIFIYYIVIILSSAWFQTGNWAYFALKYVSAFQLSIYEALAFGIGLLVEIPSGAIADLLGKKITVQVGLFMQAFGSLLFLLAPISPLLLALGNIIIIVSFALQSGAVEALAYDSLVEKGQEDKYDIIAGKAHSYMVFVLFFAAIIGGIAWKISYFLPWTLSMLTFSIAFAVSFQLKEPKVDTETFSFKQFILQNKIGFMELLKQDLRPYLPIFITVSGTYYMWRVGMIKPLMAEGFGYTGETINYLIGIITILSAMAIFNFDKVKQAIGSAKGLFLITLSSAVVWFLAGIGGGIAVGFTVFLLITVSGDLQRPWASSVMNKFIPSKYRATTISSLQFFVQIPYVIVVVFYGLLVAANIEHLFYFVTGGILLIALIYSFLKKNFLTH